MSTTSLTDRYVTEVVRRIPADQRDDVANELRATIADTVDARQDADRDAAGDAARDTDRAAAERAVLTEMGDPYALAARYADRPLVLIGPDLYPTYVRLLRMLLTVALPIVVAVLVVIEVFDSNDVGSAIGAGVNAVFTVAPQMFFWLTALFAVVERTQWGHEAVRNTGWTPDLLLDQPEPDPGSGGAWAAVVWNGLLLGLIVSQHTVPLYFDGSDRIEVLDPALWSGWIWPILGGIAATVFLELARLIRKGWTYGLVAAYALAEAAVCVPLVWLLLDQRLLNPEFVAAVDVTIPDAAYTVGALSVIAISLWEVLARLREVRRG